MLNLLNNSFETTQPRPATRRESALTELKPGKRAIIIGFDVRMPASQRELLQVYGIQPGQEIRVNQQKPVTVVQVDHTELAFETQIARLVLVRPV